MKTVTLIWQINNPEYIRFEYEWIVHIMFASFKQYHIKDDRYQTVKNNAVIIYSSNSKISEDFLKYLTQYKIQNKQFYLYHLSNEVHTNNYEYYHLAKHVFRTYYNPLINCKRLTVVPLGFQSGYNNYADVINFKERKYTFTFIGQIKSDRQLLVDTLQKIPNTFVYLTKKWNCPTSLKPHEICDIYANTIFVPCPKGWIHSDSFRIFEAIEWGSIPILKRYESDSYRYLGNHPFPIVDEWTDISLLMTKDISKLRMMCWLWYLNKKLDLAIDIYSKIESE